MDITKKGYVRLGRAGMEHRIVASEMLGRPLEKGEVVHHKNGDRMDNRPENLEVMGQREHVRIHRSIVTDYEIRELLLLGYGFRRVAARAHAGVRRVLDVRDSIVGTPAEVWLARKGGNPLWIGDGNRGHRA